MGLDCHVAAGRELLPELAALPGHLLWRAAGRTQLILDATLPSDAGIQAYAVLRVLGDGVPRSQQALALAVSTSRTTLGKVAAGLVSRGLVERVRNPDDRRSYLLTRTDAGAEAAEEWAPSVEAADAAVRAPFSAAEADDLTALLARLLVADDGTAAAPELRTFPGFLIVRAHTAVGPRFSAGLAPLGIEPRHIGSLVAVRARGPMPQTELAGYLGLSPASVVGIVDELEQRGLVERRRSTTDRRAHELHLTGEAPAVIDRARTLADAVVEVVCADLAADELERLLGYLRRVVTDA
ncbi:MarR family winged helix-turn-helix transcriptional regulator [Nocardioides bruguierae]|uniref:MarR family winged helix-turn-helix transcriptional regulator n=1 Tax=Nocardioides bruguierae TaxID=2945102 RepID=UPI0020200DD6|nr:MarR family transcriptional regulator [Nocardioides bruguierae]MCL8025275.1 MarR family transcriptional regulator [Nocardioides bruguierae]